MLSVIETAQSVILQSGTGKVEIWPQCGGILNSWQVQLHNNAWKLVEGYDSPEDFKRNCEQKGFRSCKLSPYVCRMNHSQYEFDNTRYKIGKFELAGHAIHGLLYNAVFKTLSSFADDQYAAVVLQYQYRGEDPGYPFAYDIEVAYVLRENNQLGITSSITNRHASPIPMADGWHPYFSLGRKVDELEFSMQTSDIVEFDEGLIPTGHLLEYTLFHEPTSLKGISFDHCYLLRQSLTDAACRIINRKDNIQLSVYPDKSYAFLQVYTPPHRNSIAIENLSAAPDAFNNHIGLLILEPGETVSFSTTYKAGSVE